MSDGGKGDKRRPGDNQAFDKNYEAIFSGRAQRGSYVFCPVRKELIPKDEYQSVQSNVHYVMGDIQPYQSMQTGEMITSRSHHKAHLKQHGLYEIGNEVKAHMSLQKPYKPDSNAIKRTLGEVLSSQGF
jgi:hypothetical protein